MSATLETPSKQASSALSTLDLSAPASLAAKLDASSASSNVEQQHPAKIAAAAAKPSRAELEARFVGDLDCEECDEPILQETCVPSLIYRRAPLPGVASTRLSMSGRWRAFVIQPR